MCRKGVVQIEAKNASKEKLQSFYMRVMVEFLMSSELWLDLAHVVQLVLTALAVQGLMTLGEDRL